MRVVEGKARPINIKASRGSGQCRKLPILASVFTNGKMVSIGQCWKQQSRVPLCSPPKKALLTIMECSYPTSQERLNIRARIKTKTIHQEGCILRDVLNEQFSRMSGVYIQIGFVCFLDIIVVPDYIMYKIANTTTTKYATIIHHRLLCLQTSQNKIRRLSCC